MPDDVHPLALVLAVFTGLGLAAACGLRVFVPLVALSLAARAEVVELAESFGWIASTPALVVFATATVLEVTAFYVPWLDHLLDLVATPAAALAGALVTTSVLGGMEPWLQWSLGIVAGGGVATLVHVPTAAVRVASTATTGGIANPGVATGELAGASLVSGLSLLAPITAPMVTIALVAGAVQLGRKRRREQREAREQPLS